MNFPAAKLALELRGSGIRTELGDENFRLKKAFDTAERLGISNVVIVGEDEVASNEFTLKDLKTGQQEKANTSQLTEKLASSQSEEQPAQLGQNDELLAKAISGQNLIRF